MPATVQSRIPGTGLPVALGCLVVFLTGCASARNLGTIPISPDEFAKTGEQIRAQYPDVAVYDRATRNANPLGYCTPIDELVSQWGEPGNKTTQWWRPHGIALPAIAIGGVTGGAAEGAVIAMGLLFAAYPQPVEIYTWEKGDYIIRCNCRKIIYMPLRKETVVLGVAGNSG